MSSDPKTWKVELWRNTMLRIDMYHKCISITTTVQVVIRENISNNSCWTKSRPKEHWRYCARAETLWKASFDSVWLWLIYPKFFKSHVGGKRRKPMSIGWLCDWGERAQPTPVWFERRRVYTTSTLIYWWLLPLNYTRDTYRCMNSGLLNG